MSAPRFILASASPRRRELLERVGAPFLVKPSNIDETPRADESPVIYVTRLAVEKARSIAPSAQLPVLAADTVVTIDGKLLGKPGTAEEATAMLRSLQARTHQVITGVALVAGEKERTLFESSEVTFRPLSDREIAQYVRSGEPMDKAGGYGIQGLGAALVSRINGSYTNIVGLPLAEVLGLLADSGTWRGDS